MVYSIFINKPKERCSQVGKYDKRIASNNSEKEENNRQLQKVSCGMGEIVEDANRITDIYENAGSVLENIDLRFEEATKLDGADVTFLFFAVALQCVRQYVLTKFPGRIDDQISAKQTKGHIEEHSMRKRGEWFLPTVDEIVANPVPFDTNRQTKAVKAQGPLKGGGKMGHRLVLGHDPILGWIFGTANIATSTLTNWRFQSYHVKSRMVYPVSLNKGKVDYLSAPVETVEMLFVALKRFFPLKSGKANIAENLEGLRILAASLMKEWIHLKSDINTKNSLPFPIISAFSPSLVNTFAHYGIDMCNIIAVSKQAAYAEMINVIISILHAMYCYYIKYPDIGESKKVKEQLSMKHQEGCLDLLELSKVKTRKILLYSNCIATASNVIAVAITEAVAASQYSGELAQKGLSYLDIGGLMVTIYRLISDTKFIHQVKAEFLENEWQNTVLGDKYSFIMEDESMGKKDVMKGIEIQAKVDAAKNKKIADGLEKHAELLNGIAATQIHTQNKVDVVLQDMADTEAETLYHLSSFKKPVDLDITEKRVLCASIYTLMVTYEQNAEIQTKFYLNLEQALGVSERITNFDFSTLCNVDSHTDRLVILNVLCAFLFLHNSSFSFLESDTFKFLYEFTSKKDVEAACQKLQEQFSVLGNDGVLNLYMLTEAQKASTKIEEATTDTELLEENELQAVDPYDFSELTEIIEKYTQDEQAFGKHAKNAGYAAEKALSKDFPRISSEAVIATTKLANGYLIFTTHALYLRTNSILQGKYRCIPYHKININGIKTADGMLSGTRKLYLPYLNTDGENVTAEIDDFKLSEETLRALIQEIIASECNVSDIDFKIYFDELDESLLFDFLSAVCFVIKQEHTCLAELYFLCCDYNMQNHWIQICTAVTNIEDAYFQIQNFLDSIPYPSKNFISETALRLFVGTVFSINEEEGKDSSLLSSQEEKVAEMLLQRNLERSEFNKILKHIKKPSRKYTLNELEKMEQGIDLNFPFVDAILQGIQLYKKPLEAEKQKKQQLHNTTAKLGNSIGSATKKAGKIFKKKQEK